LCHVPQFRSSQNLSLSFKGAFLIEGAFFYSSLFNRATRKIPRYKSNNQNPSINDQTNANDQIPNPVIRARVLLKARLEFDAWVLVFFLFFGSWFFVSLPR
jgi:hypothetical protein